jgi:hypothetical protein
MFTWLNKQGVRSDSGFEFQFTGRFTAEYRENGQVIDMYVDGTPSITTIYEGSIEKLWNKIQDKTERKSERSRIIRNISEALEFQGMKLDLADGQEPNY